MIGCQLTLAWVVKRSCYPLHSGSNLACDMFDFAIPLSFKYLRVDNVFHVKEDI